MNRYKPIERAILLQDIAVLLASLGVATLVRQQLVPHLPGLKPAVPPSVYVHLLLIFVPAWALCAESLNLHRVRTLTGPTVPLLRAVLATQAVGMLAISLILVAAQAPLNRSLIVLFLCLSTLLLAAAKLAQRAWVLRHHGQALALVVGPADDEGVKELESVRGRRVERLGSDAPALLRARLQADGADEVVLPATLPRERVRALLETCDEVGVPVLVAVEAMDVGLLPPKVEMVGSTLYLAYHPHEPDVPARFLKAVLDRSLAAVGLLVTLPLMAIVAILVKATSPGPVFFVQQRGGLYGRSFPMLKFRTMRAGAEAEREALLAANEMDGPVFKIANDPRVTRVGGWLRSTSLDELPQLINVLLGHMSLVGPRPLPLLETRGLVGSHRRRLSVRPGLTCLWQIKGRNELGFKEWMTLDLAYVDNWSLGLDLAILLRTVPALLSGRGAR